MKITEFLKAINVKALAVSKIKANIKKQNLTLVKSVSIL